MPKKKISKKQESSFKDIKELKYKNKEGITSFSPKDYLRDKEYIKKALFECIVENDMDSFKEILSAHLDVVNKEELAKKAGISKRTLFRMLSPEGNPTLENVSKLIHQICA